MFFSANIAHADVIFSEVVWMGNSENINAEWFEIYNNGGSEVDISNWSISGLLNFEIPAGKRISSGEYFLFGRQPVTGNYTYIPDFTPDLTYKGPLSNSGGILNLNDKEGNQKSSVTYDGKIGDNETKESMQWDGSRWVTAVPTPGDGEISNSTEEENDSNENTNDGPDTVSTSSSNKEATLILKITSKIISPKIVTANIPFSLGSFVTTNRGETYEVGKFVWNFGDGMTKQVGKSEPFEYIYQYPGDYAVTLNYYDSVLSTNPDATDRVTIKVVPAGIIISSVGIPEDPFVEINNSSNYEIVLNKWIIKGNTHGFIFPEGMIILPNKKLKLSPRITGFDASDLSSITVMDASGQIFATYPNINRSVKYSASVSSGGSSSFGSSGSNIIKSDIQKNDKIENETEVINLNDLGASVEDSGSSNVFNSKIYIWLALVGVLIIGITAVILIRRKDYPDYVEKEISAKDIKIIE